MTVNRREFVKLASSSAAAGSLVRFSSGFGTDTHLRAQIKAIALDGFVVFDPTPVLSLAESLFPGAGAALASDWRTRQFEYTWLRVSSRHFADFWQVTQDALAFAANKLKLELTPEKRDRLMNAYLELQTWPDAVPALVALKKSGFRLAFLSNFTSAMLDANLRHSGLAGLFEHALSTDSVKTYKPDPLAYQLGVDAFRLKREEILFAAFGGWDAAGAKLFGFPTYWVNRQRLPMEQLGAIPDGSGETVSELEQFLT